MNDESLCQCDRHDPPLFAACGAKAAPGEMFCAWCKSGHPGGLMYASYCIGLDEGTDELRKRKAGR